MSPLTWRACTGVNQHAAPAPGGIMNVEHEIGVLIAELTRLGAPNAAHDGKITVCSLLSGNGRGQQFDTA